MRTIYFATSNQDKFLSAQTVCRDFNIVVLLANLEIDEIQSEDPYLIVEDKARQAYKRLAKPVVVSDVSWDIPALNGFPGPYMKSINQWFLAQDFLRLMSGIENRTIIQHQFLAYCNGDVIKVFSEDVNGKIIDESRGGNGRPPSTTITVLDHDNGRTIAEVFSQGSDAVIERYRTRKDAWHEFASWYNSSN